MYYVGKSGTRGLRGDMEGGRHGGKMRARDLSTQEPWHNVACKWRLCVLYSTVRIHTVPYVLCLGNKGCESRLADLVVCH